ncbi:hypothetical protein OIE61_05680 [Streptomyces sp. NBC_01762]|uniref:hypothetical protein n=1 Tax=unclassified Streptomyces TaxID=2593676 RepID=UPI002DD8555E|nr:MULTISPECIES: hypothetical protein [unclassified Streptomyces]WSC43483.1 hypothetical protein OIE61_05680 [Streptomyces sp. NBC_01762]WSD23021.1 hypothetical protein OHA26_05740 [Streptomyces sp. NBC_01751]
MVIALVLWLLLPIAWAALPWLPPNQTFGCFVAAAQLMLSVAALSVGMPAENLPPWFLIPGLVSSVARLASVPLMRPATPSGGDLDRGETELRPPL